jgi:hypothetical protein
VIIKSPLEQRKKKRSIHYHGIIIHLSCYRRCFFCEPDIRKSYSFEETKRKCQTRRSLSLSMRPGEA